jgi:hypothetical protein
MYSTETLKPIYRCKKERNLHIKRFSGVLCVNDILDSIPHFKEHQVAQAYPTIIIDIRNSILNFNANELKYVSKAIDKEFNKIKSLSLVLFVQTPVQTAYAYLFQAQLQESPITIKIYSNYSSIRKILKIKSLLE